MVLKKRPQSDGNLVFKYEKAQRAVNHMGQLLTVAVYDTSTPIHRLTHTHSHTTVLQKMIKWKRHGDDAYNKVQAVQSDQTTITSSNNIEARNVYNFKSS